MGYGVQPLESLHKEVRYKDDICIIASTSWGKRWLRVRVHKCPIMTMLGRSPALWTQNRTLGNEAGVCGEK
jgi:hypothetical protein